MVGKNNFPLFACLTRMNDSISVVYVECLIMHLQEKHLARIPINMAIMFIQTTLFARPSIQMKDENRQNVSLKLACTVCEADNNNTVRCLLQPVFQRALVTEGRFIVRTRNLFSSILMECLLVRECGAPRCVAQSALCGRSFAFPTLVSEYYIKSIYIPWSYTSIASPSFSTITIMSHRNGIEPRSHLRLTRENKREENSYLITKEQLNLIHIDSRAGWRING